LREMAKSKGEDRAEMPEEFLWNGDKSAAAAVAAAAAAVPRAAKCREKRGNERRNVDESLVGTFLCLCADDPRFRVIYNSPISPGLGIGMLGMSTADLAESADPACC
jgi:hypothetical protein